MIPTMVHFRPLNRMSRLSTPGSPPKARCHRPLEMTAVTGEVGRSSWSLSKRPRRGDTPSVESIPPEMNDAVTRIGSVPPVRFAPPFTHPSRVSNDVESLRRVDAHQPLRLRVGQGPQEHRVDDLLASRRLFNTPLSGEGYGPWSSLS
jgi:hypothetical protein